MTHLLADIFRIEIDWMITAPHHGKNLVDAIAGKDKHFLANEYIRRMDSAMRDQFFKKLSKAWKAKDALNNCKDVIKRKKPKYENRKRKKKTNGSCQ